MAKFHKDKYLRITKSYLIFVKQKIYILPDRNIGVIKSGGGVCLEPQMNIFYVPTYPYPCYELIIDNRGGFQRFFTEKILLNYTAVAKKQ